MQLFVYSAVVRNILDEIYHQHVHGQTVWIHIYTCRKR